MGISSISAVLGKSARVSRTVVVLITQSAKNLGKGQNILLTADITEHLQYITCYVMCDDIGQCRIDNDHYMDC